MFRTLRSGGQSGPPTGSDRDLPQAEYIWGLLETPRATQLPPPRFRSAQPSRSHCLAPDATDSFSPAGANLVLAEEAAAAQPVRKPREEEAAAQPVRRCRWYYHMGWHAQRRTHSGRM